jgi:hypothetical protein
VLLLATAWPMPHAPAITTAACLPASACRCPCLPSLQDFKDQCEAYITLYGPLVFNMLITYLQVGTRGTLWEGGSIVGTR